MFSTFEKNSRLLKERYPDIYNELNRLKGNNNFQLIDCNDGNKTVKIINDEKSLLLHSKYNPVKEAEAFAREKAETQSYVNVIYGFGMGYHVMELQKKLHALNHLFVFDLNIKVFYEALKYNDLTSVLKDERIHLNITSDIGELTRELNRVLSSDENISVILHVPSVQSIPDDFEKFKFVLEDWNMRKSIDGQYNGLLYENYLSNRKQISRNIGEFFGKFEDIPFLIVSAGPSLDRNVELIKEVKNKAVIICVGSALKALLVRDIKPDFFVIIDPQDFVYHQVRGVESTDMSAIFLATASKQAVEIYMGPKFLAVQDKDYAQENEMEFIINTGGSVSTTSMDIALRMGGNPIIIVGQDLAYSDGRQHTDMYSHPFGKGQVTPLKNMRTVKGLNGETLYTTLGLLSYKRWIENRISDEKGKTFVNATEGGAFIEGAMHMSLKAAIERYMSKTYNIDQMILDGVNKS